jgi:hypothetical protein
MVARHRAPAPGKPITVGKRGGRVGLRALHHNAAPRWVSGRGCARSVSWTWSRSRAVLAEEDIEEDPDRWCSYTAWGQELWQVVCQWVWNLRLTLGKTMQGGEVREIEWAPQKEAPPCSYQWKIQLRRMDRGSGPQRSDEPPTASEPMPSPCRKMESSVARREPACG